MVNIAISGKARSGKNTVAKLLAKELKLKNDGKIKQIAFADPIKKMAKIMFPDIPNQWLYGSSELRSKIIPDAHGVDSDFNKVPLSVRQLLMNIGMEGRDYKDTIWLDAFNKSFNIKYHTICTDVRFKNEFDYLKRLGFYQIRLIRDKHLQIDHISENNQDLIKDQEFDYVLHNNGTLKSLKDEIKHIISLI